MASVSTTDFKTRLMLLLVLISVLIMALTAEAAPPHPRLLEQTAAGKAARPFFMKNMNDLRGAGINSGTNVFEDELGVSKSPATGVTAVSGEFNVLAILVQFTDEPAATSASYFDNMLFDASNISVRHYYRDASFGQLDIVTVNLPSSQGWRMAPQTYSYYVNGESGVNPDSYPRNSQGLVEDLVSLIDPVIDFSAYDNNNNDFVDVLMVIHAGQGAEVTGSDDDMWSHQWNIYPQATNDGVYVSRFTIQPEYLHSPGDMTIGVFVHELGHAFGVPDLYDTDYSSNGIGAWGVMAYGSWLGPHGDGGMPSLPSAWSRIKLGFGRSIVVSTNTNQQAIEDVKDGGDIFRVWTAGRLGDEYFLVENRQKSGYDTYIPASGLFVWHIDEDMTSNDHEWYPGLNPSSHYLVALEQSDGLFELELAVDGGDAGDILPIGNDAFNTNSPTTSDSYTLGPSLVAIENISSPAPLMYADFRVALAGSIDGEPGGIIGEDVLPDRLTLLQNYPNPFNPATTISFYSPEPGFASVNIINMLGYRVRTLFEGTVDAGVTETVWDGTNSSGNTVASGIYLYQVNVNGQKKVKKMVLVR
ncbi:MAG: M6 family metalloprotease domain-containing protein [Candidatus Zixiibacteriota bacterium]|nr:MAG: M6 family metalloprotease domain-containing protein [candidate division Zixibacteria bacterium]